MRTSIYLDLILRRWAVSFKIDFFLLYLFWHFSENLLPIEYLAERSYVVRDVDTVNIFNWLENLFYDEFACLAFKLCEEDKVEQIR